MLADREALARYAEAWGLAAQGLLFVAGWMPTPLRGGPWRDTTTDRTLPEHQAVDEARRACERIGPWRHFAKTLDALEETLLLASGWNVTATKGGIAWRSPEGVTHSRAEGATIIRMQLAEGV